MALYSVIKCVRENVRVKRFTPRDNHLCKAKQRTYLTNLCCTAIQIVPILFYNLYGIVCHALQTRNVEKSAVRDANKERRAVSLIGTQQIRGNNSMQRRKFNQNYTESC